MAALDEFFDKAIKIARDLGKARVARRQKQQDVVNLTTNRSLDLEERRVATGESRAETTADLGQQNVDLDRARLAVRESLGEGQLSIGRRKVGVSEQGANLEASRFERTGNLFNRFFPDPDAGGNRGGGGGAGFRQQSDQGVLNSARSLVGTSRESGLSNPRIQGVINDARRRTRVQNTLEQDLLNLR